MLNRLITRSSHLRLLATVSSRTHSSTPNTYTNQRTPVSTSPAFNSSFTFRFFSSNERNNGGNSNDQPKSPADLWKLSPENDQNVDAVFGEGTGHVEGISVGEAKPPEDDDWLKASAEDTSDDLFKKVDGIEVGSGVSGFEEYKPWSLAEEKKEEGDVFGIGGDVTETVVDDLDEKSEVERAGEARIFEAEEKELSEVLKGPNRAFGDLIAASGITDAMLDSLIALKDLDGVEGLPPLREIEDMRYEKNTRKSARAEIERLKQEEVAKARVREVDEKGRAYGTGRRKCSIARVWIQPGNGKFVVNDKEFDVYFPMLDHRAALLRPFSETKTLGTWDISCTVKGGGFSGQVGAIQLGISRALQNWEPELRPPLKAVGFLTRDSRVVERKKPGKAKARKSFQWVKR